MNTTLNERQKAILLCIVDYFIETATPVASHHIAQKRNFGISTATIRNIMAELEELGLVTHPHTSAGKMPTDIGYRFFVDSLMTEETLTKNEKLAIRNVIETVTEIDELLRQTAKIVGAISHQLSIVSAPHLRSGVLERIELINVSTNKILVVLSVRSGIIKTITMEVCTEIQRFHLDYLSRLLNERLCGLTLEMIRNTFAERVKDFKDEKSGLIDLFINSVDKIFDDTKEREKLHIAGTKSLIEQPEYTDPENVRNIIELINNEEVISDIIDRQEPKAQAEGISISIGREIGEKRLENHSFIVSTYKIGDVYGTITIIGPKRMKYGKLKPLLNYVSEQISLNLNREN